AVDDRLHASRSQLFPDAYARSCEKSRAERMTTERATDIMDADPRQRLQIGPRAVGYEMNLVRRLCREIPRQGMVGRVHAAERCEITRDDQPRSHAEMRGRLSMAPCSAPSRNQNCIPAAVPKGTKLKTSASVPKLAAITAAAHS